MSSTGRVRICYVGGKISNLGSNHNFMLINVTYSSTEPKL